MRDEARVIQLNEWAARTNAETRRVMGVSVVPEECRSARAYLAGLMTDEEAAARVAADVERVRAIRDPWSGPSWRDAAIEYREARGSRPFEVEIAPHELARLRALLDDSVTLERAWRELSKPAPAPTATLQAAEFLVLTGDVARLRRWLAQHSAQERTAIRKYLEAKRCRSRRTK